MSSRARLFRSTIALVERVECSPAGSGLSAEDFSPDFQVAFPYRGMFVWHVGHDIVVSDPTQVLFIRGGEPFRVAGPRPEGFGEIIITPTPSALSTVSEAAGGDVERHPLFSVRRRRATPHLQRRCAQFLHGAHDAGGSDGLGADEQLLTLLQQALALEPHAIPASPRTRLLIRRTKEFLDAEFTNRVQLSDIANAVGASAAYLTDVFRRFEGVSLQRYVTQLRLARSLVELPHASDITTLALDLGFSSHSHFTLAFRRAFGCTPSAFRQTTRRGLEHHSRLLRSA